MRICGELHPTLGADVAPSALVLHLVCSQLAGVGEASATEAAAVGFDVSVLEHVSLQVAGLGETLLANSALMGSSALVGQQVGLEVTGLLEELAAVWTCVWLYAVVAQDVCDQVVLRGVGFIAHPALPTLQTISHIYAVRFIDLDVYIKSVNPAATMPTRRLVVERLLLVLAPCAPICPHHVLTAVFVLTPHAHLPGIIAADFTGLEVAADGFILLRGFNQTVPLVFYVFFCLSPTST